MKVNPRHHPRLASVLPITYVVDGDCVVHHGSTRDISGGGLHFETSEGRLENDVRIAIAFEIRGVSLSARGRVVSSRYDAANVINLHRVAFESITQEHQTLVATFVLRNALEAILTQSV